MLLIACDGAPSATDSEYGGLRGSVRVDGSSTVFPLSEAVAEEFSKVSRVRVNVGFSGTGGGFEKLCRGAIDINDASRAITQGELARCSANGIDDLVELQVAIDALTVMVHADNDFVDCLTTAELNLLFRAGGARSWAGVRPEWPDEAIDFFHPGTDSGTFDYFVEAIIDGVDGEWTHRGDGTASEDDNILVQGIRNDPNAIGYIGFAHFLDAGQALKLVAIDDGNSCVRPSFESALNGSYAPLSRPLFIYTTARSLQERPEVLGFVEFYLEHSAALVSEVGYITLPDELFDAQMAKLAPFVQLR